MCAVCAVYAVSAELCGWIVLDLGQKPFASSLFELISIAQIYYYEKRTQQI